MITVEFRNALYYPTLYFGWDQRAECTQAHENTRVSTYSLLNDDRDDFFSTVQAVVECLSRAYHRVPVFLFEQTHACFCQKCPKQESFFHSRICLKIVLCRSFQNTSHTERAYIRQRYMECSYERHIDRTLADVGAELMAIFSIIFVNSLFLSPTSQHNYPATEVLYLLHHQPLPHLSVIKRCLHIRTNVFEWLPCIQPHTWTFTALTHWEPFSTCRFQFHARKLSIVSGNGGKKMKKYTAHCNCMDTCGKWTIKT